MVGRDSESTKASNPPATQRSPPSANNRQPTNNNTTGAKHACEVVYSDLGNVKAQLVSPLEAGTYTLAVFTRSGLGGEYGVRKATRKVKVA